jgi:hypothetical protein
MTRTQKVAALLARQADDTRRFALDSIDDAARRSNTFGSKQHRTARDAVEGAYDAARLRYEKLSDEELDEELAV